MEKFDYFNFDSGNNRGTRTRTDSGSLDGDVRHHSKGFTVL